jgi:hypothetical protein
MLKYSTSAASTIVGYEADWLDTSTLNSLFALACMFVATEFSFNKPLPSNGRLHDTSLTPVLWLSGIMSQYVGSVVWCLFL